MDFNGPAIAPIRSHGRGQAAGSPAPALAVMPLLAPERPSVAACHERTLAEQVCAGPKEAG